MSSLVVMCIACNGSGVGVSGDPSTNCTVCGGTGGVINRDSKGRFAKYIAPTAIKESGEL